MGDMSVCTPVDSARPPEAPSMMLEAICGIAVSITKLQSSTATRPSVESDPTILRKIRDEK